MSLNIYICTVDWYELVYKTKKKKLQKLENAEIEIARQRNTEKTKAKIANGERKTYSWNKI